MSNQLQLGVGSYSDKGRKDLNQDAHGHRCPNGALLDLKGAAFAIADGISTSPVSHIASQTAVNNFLEDYYCTSEAWSVGNAALRVLQASNAWLHAQWRRSEFRFNQDKGYVCTFSALIFKACQAHLFHAGDSRIYRLRDGALEQLTHDHRLVLNSQQSYLSRAMGVEPQIEFDQQSLPLRVGDLYLMSTDGVHDYTDADFLHHSLTQHPEDLNRVAKQIVDHALEQGSDDNLTLQLVRVETLPQQTTSQVQQQIDELPFPPELEPRAEFDGYRILRRLHGNSRSHVYLAVDQDNESEVVLKIPSVDLREDPDYLERFLMEEWVARRINSAHVLKAGRQQRPSQYLYTVFEYIDGQSLAQWLTDNPQPDLEKVRDLIEQSARALMALHRMEILHQDLRPENLMIDRNGTVKLIDFGAARVAGLVEADPLSADEPILGTALYTAPEYFIGELADHRADLYSLAVLAYQLLSGRFPYGTQVAKTRSLSAQRKLRYQSVLDEEREIPIWIDETLKQALQPNPQKRYQELSEFLFDLRQPNRTFLNKTRPPLLERNPVAVWQGISAVLAMVLIYLLSTGPL